MNSCGFLLAGSEEEFFLDSLPAMSSEWTSRLFEARGGSGSSAHTHIGAICHLPFTQDRAENVPACSLQPAVPLTVNAAKRTAHLAVGTSACASEYMHTCQDMVCQSQPQRMLQPQQTATALASSSSAAPSPITSSAAGWPWPWQQAPPAQFQTCSDTIFSTSLPVVSHNRLTPLDSILHDQQLSEELFNEILAAPWPVSSSSNPLPASSLADRLLRPAAPAAAIRILSSSPTTPNLSCTSCVAPMNQGGLALPRQLRSSMPSLLPAQPQVAQGPQLAATPLRLLDPQQPLPLPPLQLHALPPLQPLPQQPFMPPDASALRGGSGVSAALVADDLAHRWKLGSTAPAIWDSQSSLLLPRSDLEVPYPTAAGADFLGAFLPNFLSEDGACSMPAVGATAPDPAPAPSLVRAEPATFLAAESSGGRPVFARLSDLPGAMETSYRAPTTSLAVPALDGAAAVDADAATASGDDTADDIETGTANAVERCHGSGGGRGPRGACGIGSRVTLEALRSMFELPVQEVVRALGISATDLKRRCRALGIQRWPQRKLLSLRRLTEAVEGDPHLTDEERREMLDRVARNRADIMRDPDVELEACLKPLRQVHYKRSFMDRRGHHQG